MKKILLAVALMGGILTGCTNKEEKTMVSQTTKQEKTSYNSDYSTRTDNWGVGLHVGFAQNGRAQEFGREFF